MPGPDLADMSIDATTFWRQVCRLSGASIPCSRIRWPEISIACAGSSDAAIRKRLSGHPGAAVGHGGPATSSRWRSWRVTEAARHGVATLDTMAIMTHRSVETLRRYYRPAELAANPAARL